MKIYFAPLEGVTVYPFRTAHLSLFSGVDRYFLPFVSVHSSKSLKNKEKKDLMAEHNPEGKSVPQLLANDAEQFLAYVPLLTAYQYDEINLNLGCPSGTVVSKHKGAGFLGVPDELDAFLEQIFRTLDGSDVRISVKTRIGIADAAEADELIKIYNRYPISELTVHPRLQKQFYRGLPDLNTFRRFYEEIRIPLCYNGDINSKEDAERIMAEFPNLHALMLGRGLIANPALAREIQGGAPLTIEEMRAYHDRIYQNWVEALGDPNNVLHRMKELWDYLKWSFEDCEKLEKKIRKAKKSEEYLAAVDTLFSNCTLHTR